MTKTKIEFKNDIRIVLKATDLIDEYGNPTENSESVYENYTRFEFTNAIRRYLELTDKEWQDVQINVIATKDNVKSIFKIDYDLFMWTIFDMDALKDTNAQKMTEIKKIIDG